MILESFLFKMDKINIDLPDCAKNTVKDLMKMADIQMRHSMHTRFLENCLSESLIPKGMQVNLKIHIGEDSDEIQTVVNKILEKTLLEITRVVRDEHQKQLVDSKPKMKELEKQLREKVRDRDKISEINSQIFQITEMKKNEILEKQNKKLSRLRTARDASDSSIKKHTDSSQTAKENGVNGGGKKQKHSKKRKNKKSTAVPQNKQPELKTKSSSLRSDMNCDSNSQQTANPVNRKTKDQDSPVIDLTKETGKNSNRDTRQKNYQSLGSNQKNSYAEAVKRGNSKANLQTAISNLITCLQNFQETEGLSEYKTEKNGGKPKGRKPHYRGERKQ